LVYVFLPFHRGLRSKCEQHASLTRTWRGDEQQQAEIGKVVLAVIAGTLPYTSKQVRLKRISGRAGRLPTTNRGNESASSRQTSNRCSNTSEYHSSNASSSDDATVARGETQRHERAQ